MFLADKFGSGVVKGLLLLLIEGSRVRVPPDRKVCSSVGRAPTLPLAFVPCQFKFSAAVKLRDTSWFDSMYAGTTSINLA